MKALVVEDVGEYQIKEFPIPEPGKGQVLIKVDTCGLCGTDVHIYKGSLSANLPLVIGHEVAGKVVDVGEKVKKVKIGDFVVLDPNTYCGLCRFCRRGMVHLCENLINFGVRVNGGFAEYLVAEETYIYPLSKKINLEEAALTEPLSCCIHGIDLASIEWTDYVVILGAGTVGLIMSQLVKLKGAAKLVVVEPIRKRRELAQRLGADFVLDPSKEDILRSIPQILGQAPDVVIECVGKKETMEKSWRLVSPGGKVVWFGVADPKEEISISPYQIYQKEITIKGSFVNPYTTEKAIRLLEEKKVNLKKLITHRFSLEDFDKAIEIYEKDKERIKIVIKP